MATEEAAELHRLVSELRTILRDSGDFLLDQPAPVTLAVLEDRDVQSLDRALLVLALGLRYVASPFDRGRSSSRQLGDLLGRIATVAVALLASLEMHRLSAAIRTLPPNWKGLREGDLAAALILARENSICVAWTPDPTTVRLLLDADTEHETVFVNRRRSILAHASSQLEPIEAGPLGDYAHLAQRACTALSDAHHEASHALAVDVINALIENEISAPPGGVAQYARQVDSSVITARALTRSLVLAAAGPAFESTKRGSVPEERFNRHMTCHVAPIEQFSPANALRATTLAVALLLDETANREPQ